MTRKSPEMRQDVCVMTRKGPEMSQEVCEMTSKCVCKNQKEALK